MRKKVLSVLLCLVLLLGTLSTAVFAEDSTRYVVLGDSIAYGSGLSNPTEAVYGKIVADTNGYIYENYSIPGSTTQALLIRIENPTVKQAIENADIINISIGGNNFLLGNLNQLLFDSIVKNDHTRFDEIADKLYEDLDTIITNIRELNAGAVILLQTLYNPQTGYVGEAYEQGAQRINAKINEYAQNNPENILVVDVASRLTDSDNDFADDRIHPSAAGNEKIAAAVLQTLYENGLGTETVPVISVKGKDARGTGMFTIFVDLYGRFFHLLSVIRSMFSGLLK
ncbi:MAG: hypothetical protein J1E34_05360 [Oscillospiraceae bacterium]|nr:hypothetical protein [Oscillospiraceae bacterium]